jgi:hypothetical protein
MELINDSSGCRDFFEKRVCYYKKLNIIVKTSTRDEYEVERKQSWHYVHVRLGAHNDLLKSLTTFTAGNEELSYLLMEVEVGDIFKRSSLK